MSLNLAGFIKNLLPSFNKSDLEADLEFSVNQIDDIISAYESLDEILKVIKLKDKEVLKCVKTFMSEIDKASFKTKLPHNANLPKVTTIFLKNAKTNGEVLLKELNDTLNDVIVSQALTAYKVNLMRSVSHYYFMTKTAMDFLNFIYAQEAVNEENELSKRFDMNKKEKELLIKNLWIYARLLTVYGEEPTVFKKKMNELGDVVLPKEKIDEAIDAFNDNKLDITNSLPVGFIGSPIFTIRMIFAQWTADRYHSLKDKKRLLELRYLHLKVLKEQGTNDVNLEKEIAHLQDAITSIEKKLYDIEKDL